MPDTTTNGVDAPPKAINNAEESRNPALADQDVQKWSEVTSKPWKFPKKSTGGSNIHIRSPYTFPRTTPKPPAPEVQIPAPINGQKRGLTSIIDLTGEDEEETSDEILSPRKKSRTSSNSSHQSVKLAAKPVKDERGSQKQVSYKSAQTENQSSHKNSFGKDPRSASFDRPASKEGPPKVVIKPPRKPPRTAPTQEEIEQRRQFTARLAEVPYIEFRNDVDYSSPPESFRFVAENVLREGVTRVDEGFMSGCRCRKRRGVNECRYAGECECLQDSGISNVKRHAYHEMSEKKGCLVPLYLQSRYHIFECNSKCDCSENCKNRVVQYGCKIKLQLFKTKDRGFGLRTMEPLKAGQFIDTYRGEIITQAEAERRSAGRHPDEDIYLFALDKFVDNSADDSQQSQGQQGQARYVCDGRNLGGPTRFMNHSCAPNCRLFTVSYNHADTDLYELAFFTKEDVPAGAELTFDYLDLEDDEEQGDVKFTDDMARKHEIEHGYMPSRCRCGSDKCRGYFFFMN